MFKTRRSAHSLSLLLAAVSRLAAVVIAGLAAQNLAGQGASGCQSVPVPWGAPLPKGPPFSIVIYPVYSEGKERKVAPNTWTSMGELLGYVVAGVLEGKPFNSGTLDTKDAFDLFFSICHPVHEPSPVGGESRGDLRARSALSTAPAPTPASGQAAPYQFIFADLTGDGILDEIVLDPSGCRRHGDGFRFRRKRAVDKHISDRRLQLLRPGCRLQRRREAGFGNRQLR